MHEEKHSTPAALQALIWMRPARRASLPPPRAPRRWSRYERLSFSMLGCTWGILVAVVALLHAGNWQRETKTSSTSGAHTGFYGSAAAVKAASQGSAPGVSPAHEPPQDVQP